MWISKSISYKKTKIYKDTFWGKRVKGGYELTKDLIYEYRPNAIFVLKSGYVWDGSSWGKLIEKLFGWLLGSRESDSHMAASAFHDCQKIPTEIKDSKGVIHTTFKIKKSAKLYSKMIKEWPDNDISKDSRKIQKWSLIHFQWIYRLISGGEWKKLKEDS